MYLLKSISYFSTEQNSATKLVCRLSVYEWSVSCYTILLRSAFDALSIGSGPVAAVSLCVNRELRFHIVCIINKLFVAKVIPPEHLNEL